MPSPRSPVKPRPAASVVLLRDAPADVEVFLVERHGRADFARAHVFPGGMLERSDAGEAVEGFCCGLDDRQASMDLSVESGGLAYWVAAIRECFEESGFLMACDESGAYPNLAEGPARSRFQEYRRALISGEIGIRDICDRERLALATDRMHYFGFFITPEAAKRRYSTRFFIAGVPQNQVGIHDGSETVGSRWITPRSALQLYREGSFVLAPPTVIILEQLSAYGNRHAALDAARRKDKSEIPAILPTVERRGETVTVRVLGYPDITDPFL